MSMTLRMLVMSMTLHKNKFRKKIKKALIISIRWREKNSNKERKYFQNGKVGLYGKRTKSSGSL